MGFLNENGEMSKTVLDSLSLSKTDYIQTNNINSKTRQDTLSKTVQDRSADIAELLSGITKSSSPRYQQAMDKIRRDPLAYRRDKVLRKMRKSMSADRANEISIAVSQLHHTELVKWLSEVEQQWG